jgi:S1 RNA binding domain protein
MINEGQIVEGKVTVITNFGAFVRFESGETGMVHISEIAEGFVKDIRDYLKEGQTVKCKSLGPGKDGKLSLSIKRAENDGQRPERSNNQPRSRSNFDNRSFNQEEKSVSFEDRLSKFMKDSDERMLDLKRKMDNRKGGGYGKRSSMKS